MGETKASRAVRDWTKQPGHNQTELARRLTARLGKTKPIAQSTISQIVAGHSVPRGDLMAAIRAELGVEFDWWLEPAAPASSPVLPDVDDDRDTVETVVPNAPDSVTEVTGSKRNAAGDAA